MSYAETGFIEGDLSTEHGSLIFRDTGERSRGYSVALGVHGLPDALEHAWREASRRPGFQSYWTRLHAEVSRFHHTSLATYTICCAASEEYFGGTPC
jgi:hypothetical protein